MNARQDLRELHRDAALEAYVTHVALLLSAHIEPNSTEAAEAERHFDSGCSARQAASAIVNDLQIAAADLARIKAAAPCAVRIVNSFLKIERLEEQ